MAALLEPSVQGRPSATGQEAVDPLGEMRCSIEWDGKRTRAYMPPRLYGASADFVVGVKKKLPYGLAHFFSKSFENKENLPITRRLNQFLRWRRSRQLPNRSQAPIRWSIEAAADTNRSQFSKPTLRDPVVAAASSRTYGNVS